MIKADKFVFQEAAFHPDVSSFEFSYRVESGGKVYVFTENLKVSGPEVATLWARVPNQIKQALLDSLHLMLGVQYWSMFACKGIELENIKLNKDQATFWNTVYTKGLAEFFYSNQINWRGLVQFPFVDAPDGVLEHYQRSDRVLLAFGGGKDSIVAAEILKQTGEQFALFSLGVAAVQVKAGEVVGRPLIAIRRQIDRKALTLLTSGKVYRGHIPYTAIYTFTGLLAAVLFDYSRLVFANEKSADEGNVEYLGMEVNHQWSKSSEFESLIRDYIARFITKDVETYSMLRQYTELEITEKFAGFPQYHHSFSSCNMNFSHRASHSDGPFWCGRCAKCAFVFTALAAYLPREKVVSIVGKDMFADESLLPVFEQLAGLRDFKPFECVGTTEEMRAALRAATARSINDRSVILTKVAGKLP